MGDGTFDASAAAGRIRVPCVKSQVFVLFSLWLLRQAELYLFWKSYKTRLLAFVSL